MKKFCTVAEGLSFFEINHYVLRSIMEYMKLCNSSTEIDIQELCRYVNTHCKVLVDDQVIVRMMYYYLIRQGPMLSNDNDHWNMTGGTGW